MFYVNRAVMKVFAVTKDVELRQNCGLGRITKGKQWLKK